MPSPKKIGMVDKTRGGLRQSKYVKPWPWKGQEIRLFCPCGLQNHVDPLPEWQARIRPSKPRINWDIYVVL